MLCLGEADSYCSNCQSDPTGQLLLPPRPTGSDWSDSSVIPPPALVQEQPILNIH